jgi:hypothetical protein
LFTEIVVRRRLANPVISKFRRLVLGWHFEELDLVDDRFAVR